MSKVLNIMPIDVKERLKRGEKLHVVDVRENAEVENGMIPGAKHIRLSEIPERICEIDPNAETIMVCRSGGRSSKQILEVCNPVEAKRVLTQNSLVGYFLPCKITVYQGDDGKTRIGMPKPTVLMDVLNDPTLKEIASGIEKTLIEAINEAR